MKLVYRITEQDFEEAYDLFRANEKPVYRRIVRRLMPWLGGVVLISAVMVGVRNPLSLVFGFMVASYLLYNGVALRRYFSKSLRNDPRFRDEFTSHISDEGIHITTVSEDSHVKWAGFIRALESDKIFLLFHTAWSFNIFPKRAFANGEVEQFRDLIRRNISSER